MAKSRKQYDEDDEETSGQIVGPCKSCQFYDIDRDEDEEIPDETIAPCVHPDLEEYNLKVSGDSGCNLFELVMEPEEDEDEEEDEDDEEDDDY